MLNDFVVVIIPKSGAKLEFIVDFQAKMRDY